MSICITLSQQLHLIGWPVCEERDWFFRKVCPTVVGSPGGLEA